MIEKVGLNPFAVLLNDMALKTARALGYLIAGDPTCIVGPFYWKAPSGKEGISLKSLICSLRDEFDINIKLAAIRHKHQLIRERYTHGHRQRQLADSNSPQDTDC